VIVQERIHPWRAADMVSPDRLVNYPAGPTTSYLDLFGNQCSRPGAPQGGKTLGHVGHAPDGCAPVLSLIAIAAKAQVQYLRNAASTWVNRPRLRLASWVATEQTFKRTHSRFVE
jgi:hypothetical protein